MYDNKNQKKKNKWEYIQKKKRKRMDITKTQIEICMIQDVFDLENENIEHENKKMIFFFIKVEGIRYEYYKYNFFPYLTQLY